MLKAVSVSKAASPPDGEDRFASLHPDALSPGEQSSVVDLALAVVSRRFRPGQPLGSSEKARRFLRLRCAGRRNEVFGMIYLDSQNRLIEIAEHFEGTVNAAAVHVRVVVERALATNAAAALAFHNHPSGCAEPSRADIDTTKKLREALALVDVRLLDHFVVAGQSVTSLAERELI